MSDYTLTIEDDISLQIAGLSLTASGDVGDFNGWQPASFNGDTSSTTNGDVQVPDDDGYVYQRVAGQWWYGGTIGGLAEESDPSTFVWAGDDIFAGTPVRDTDDDRIYTYNGSTWVRAEANVLRIADGMALGEFAGLTGAQWIDGTSGALSGDTLTADTAGTAQVMVAYKLAAVASADVVNQCSVCHKATEISNTGTYSFGVGIIAVAGTPGAGVHMVDGTNTNLPNTGTDICFWSGYEYQGGSGYVMVGHWNGEGVRYTVTDVAGGPTWEGGANIAPERRLSSTRWLSREFGACHDVDGVNEIAPMLRSDMDFDTTQHDDLWLFVYLRADTGAVSIRVDEVQGIIQGVG